jgi:SpoVK/Ycf46/Vps4 family AAA+-type ATPase
LSLWSRFNSYKNGVKNEANENSAEWDKIGGYKSLINQIRFYLDSISSTSNLFDTIGIRPPKGILLYSLPGCSKTTIARTIAKSRSLYFISVKGADVFKKWVGDSEKGVEKIFDEARQNSPSVIFFYEFDSIASSRCESGSVENRVIGQILSELDGLHSSTSILVIAATNRPNVLDPAILRAGRFDIHISVPLPDLCDRIDIVSKELSKSTLLSSSINIREVANMMDGFSGAEIVYLCKQVLIREAKRNLFKLCEK